MKLKAEPERYSPHQEPQWYKTVWNLKVAPKVKLFVWKALKKALPVGKRLTERHINVDNRCKRCGTPESITHLLFNCHYTQQVWNLTPLASDFDARGMIELGDVWNALSLKTCLPPTGLVSGQLTPWILWAIWKDQNKVIFEGRSGSPEETLTSAITAAKKWDAKVLTEKVSSRRPPLASCPQHRNTEVRIRTDGAWRKEDRAAGLGWTIQSLGQTSSSQLFVHRVNSPLMAEGLVLREALISCKELEVKTITVESDSSILIKTACGLESVAELHGILAYFRKLSCCFDSVCFNWILRDQNIVADKLVKDALFIGEAFMTLTQPL